jgi:hypothetical protein
MVFAPSATRALMGRWYHPGTTTTRASAGPATLSDTAREMT